MTNPVDTTLRISVCVCTRDRAPMLERALRSLVGCGQELGVSWEVVVVDNGSSDETHSTAARFADDLPLRLVVEPTAGLSNARNRAVRESRGEWVLFIDDDVSVHPQWLDEYARAIDRHPDAVVLGGVIDVQLEGSPPGWILAGVHLVEDAYAGRSSRRFDGRLCTPGPTPYGANFALRRERACRIPFDPNLGRHPDRQVSGGEETRVMATLLSSGAGWWVPQARVTHHIDESRQTARYLRSYYAWAGRTYSRRPSQIAPHTRLVGAVRSFVRASAHQLRYWALCVRSSDTPARVGSLKMAALHWGRGIAWVRPSSPPGRR